MKTAACYVRVSTDDQLEYSPDSQIKEIRKYAKAHDLFLPDDLIFVEEEGVSGRKAEKRHEFQRMIGTAKKKPKPFDVLLLWKFSRFARNREDSIVYKSMLRKQLGIEVISISESIGDDKMSVILEAMIEAMDEYYSINLAEEVKRGMTEKAKRGEALSIAPFGYNMVHKQLIPDPENAPVVQEVFNRFVGGEGFRNIAIWLNSVGVRTKRGNMLENRTVEYWLNNPVYHGYIRWTPTGKTRRDYHNPDSLVTKGTHEPLIDEETWGAVQDILTERKKAYTKNRRESVPNSYALSGILRCPACGSSISRSNAEYMQCCGYAHGSCKSSCSVKMSEALTLLLSALSDDIKTQTFHIAQLQKKDSSAETVLVSQQIEREEQKLIRAKQAYLSGADTVEEYASNKKDIQAEIARLKSQLCNISEMPKPDLAKLSKRNEKAIAILLDKTATETEKNSMLKSVISRAIFHKNERYVEVLYTEL